MEAALEAGIHQFNVESFGELETLNDVAARDGRARRRSRLRINPDVDAKTHAKISTGKSENKFGIDIEQAAQFYSAAARMKGIGIVGLAVHIGSQLTDIAPYRAAFLKIAELAQTLRKAGLTVERIDLGGGIGIAYRDEADHRRSSDYAGAGAGDHRPARHQDRDRARAQHRRRCRPAGVAGHQREGGRQSQIRDRRCGDERPDPARLYDAYHEIMPVAEPAERAPVERVDVVGPICETGDLFAEQRPLPPVKPGDLVAFCTAGAYGAGHVFDLQHPAAGGRSPGPRRPFRRGPAAANL